MSEMSDTDIVSELRKLHAEILASDEGRECEMMALVRKSADEIERLRDALALLIGTIEMHEMESLQCDRTDERYCNCLRESAARAKALLSEVRVRTAEEEDED